MIRIQRYAWSLVVVWSIVMTGSLVWNLVQQQSAISNLALNAARINCEKDIFYRKWGTAHGGVYVPVTSETQPNPYLSHIPERDISTPSGRLLTLINPAYMTRQVYDLIKKESAIREHLTSLLPLRPENAPDPWEIQALQAFEQGRPEVITIENLGGQPVLRLMRPFRTEKGCLQCHAGQGYKEGEIRGGVSISIPLGPLWAIGRQQLFIICISHGLIWLFGLAGICWGAHRLQRSLKEQRRAEAELTKANEIAQAATKAKSELLANMSHEIRTPINGVIGTLELLSGTKLNEEQQEYVAVIQTCSNSLLTLINDILDYSKIEAGKLDFEIIDFNLETIIDSIVDVLALQAQEKKLELISLINTQTPLLVRGDPIRLRQVILNLAANAIKFTSQGSVILEVNLKEETETQATILFSVKDTGIGIPPDRIDRLFKSFSQVDSSTTRKYGGTGLGLAISAQLTEKMGGEIGVETEEGKGSTFWFSVALDKQPVKQPLLFSSALQNIRILVLAENNILRQFLLRVLSSWECRGEEAATGKEALAKLRQAVTEQDSFQVAILDMGTTDNHDENLVKQIIDDPEFQETHLVLVTGRVKTLTEETRWQEIGGASHISKPVRRSRLFNCLINIFAQKEIVTETCPGPVVISHGGSEGRRDQLRILVAEDNVTNQFVAKQIIEKLGYFVKTVANGKEAVQAVQTGSYDLVFMDVQMPEMDGFEATAAIREHEKEMGHHTPIFALTAHAMQGDRERCVAAGMDDYLTKPIKSQEIRAAIERWMDPSCQQKNNVIKEINENIVFDKASVMANTENDEELFREIIKMFLENAPHHLNSLIKSMKANDAHQVEQEAHSLKGAAANIGANIIRELAAQIEQAGKKAEIEAAKLLMIKLLKEFENFKEVLSIRRL